MALTAGTVALLFALAFKIVQSGSGSIELGTGGLLQEIIGAFKLTWVKGSLYVVVDFDFTVKVDRIPAFLKSRFSMYFSSCVQSSLRVEDSSAPCDIAQSDIELLSQEKNILNHVVFEEVNRLDWWHFVFPDWREKDKAYLREALVWHPDRVSLDRKEEAKLRFELIADTYKDFNNIPTIHSSEFVFATEIQPYLLSTVIDTLSLNVLSLLIKLLKVLGPSIVVLGSFMALLRLVHIYKPSYLALDGNFASVGDFAVAIAGTVIGILIVSLRLRAAAFVEIYKRFGPEEKRLFLQTLLEKITSDN